MTAPHTSAHGLEKALADLRTSDDSARAVAVNALTRVLHKRQRDLGTAAFASDLEALTGRLRPLAESQRPEDCFAAVATIESMLSLGEINEALAVKLVSLLTRTFGCADPHLADYASRVYASVVSLKDVELGAHIDVVLKSSIEALQETSNSFRVMASCSMLRELASVVPQALVTQVSAITEGISGALVDLSAEVRVRASQALSAVLAFAKNLENGRETIASIIRHLSELLTQDSEPVIHGALLGLRETLVQAPASLLPDFRTLADVIFGQKQRPESSIRTTFLSLLPVLAACDPPAFTAHYLPTSMHLLTEAVTSADQIGFEIGATSTVCLRARLARLTGLQSIARIAATVSGSILPYIEPVVHRLCKTVKRQRLDLTGRSDSSALFGTISRLTLAIGSEVPKSMESLLRELLQCPMSSALIACLSQFAVTLPSSKSKIRERLLQLISQILTGGPWPENAYLFGIFADPSPSNSLGHYNVRGPRNPLLPSSSLQRQPEWQTILAIRTFGDFDFGRHQLSYYAANVIMTFVHDPRADVRIAAIVACCEAVSKEVPIKHCAGDLASAITRILDAVLKRAVIDRDARVREIALKSLKQPFDRYLARPEMISTILLALNDESFIVRTLSASLLGRCAAINPARTLPLLRKAIISLSKELTYSWSERAVEEAAVLIGILLPSARDAAKPLIKPLLAQIIEQAREADRTSLCSLVDIVKILCEIAGDDVAPHTDAIVDLLIEMLTDRSFATKRLQALRTISTLASYTSAAAFSDKHSVLMPLIFDMLLTEPNHDIRIEAIRAIGYLGAKDPFSTDANSTLVSRRTTLDEVKRDESVEAVIGAGPAHEDYYLFVVMHQLVSVLRDPSLIDKHSIAFDTIIKINRNLRIRCAPFWSDLVPTVLQAMRRAILSDEWWLKSLIQLVEIMQEHIVAHLDSIARHLLYTWDYSPAMRLPLIELIEVLATYSGAGFRQSLEVFLPLLLRSLRGLRTKDEQESTTSVCMRVLRCLTKIGPELENHMELIAPLLASSLDASEQILPVRVAATHTIIALAEAIDLGPYSTRIVYSLVHNLRDSAVEAKASFASALHAIARNMRYAFQPFVSIVENAMRHSGQSHDELQCFINILKEGINLPPQYTHHEPRQNSKDQHPVADAGTSRQLVSFHAVAKALEVQGWDTADDWRLWLRRLSDTLLRNSPIFPLRACGPLADVQDALARDLTAPAFFSVYVDLSSDEKDRVARSIEEALRLPAIPNEICQAVLNIVEYCERHNCMLSISVQNLGQYAMGCQSYAKALHYKELECLVEPSFESIETIGQINQILEQMDVNGGILNMAEQLFQLEPSPEWYERLECWDEALSMYEHKDGSDPARGVTALGRLRCLSALAQWQQLSEAVHPLWSQAAEAEKRQLAPLGAVAAWGQHDFRTLSTYLPFLQESTFDHAWYTAVLAANEERYSQACHYIRCARNVLNGDLKPLVGGSYTRSYRHVVRAQMLSELEEAIDCKESSKSISTCSERRNTIRANWINRLSLVQGDVETWRCMINIHKLVFQPAEIADTYIYFANLCRRSGDRYTALNALDALLSLEDAEGKARLMRGTPLAVYARIKLIFHDGQRDEAIAHLRDLATDLSSDLALPADLDISDTAKHVALCSESGKVDLLSKIYRKIGHWQTLLRIAHNAPSDARDIARCLRISAKLRPEWAKPWHALALHHEDIANEFLCRVPERSAPMSGRITAAHVVPAIHAFFRSLAVGHNSAFLLQDVLRLLNLLFNFGTHPDVIEAVDSNITTIGVDLWLGVVPQLLARLSASTEAVRRVIQRLLHRVGRAHPQALIFPLAVASQYTDVSQRNDAKALLDRLRDHSAPIVEQGLLIGRELVRVAMLWHEMWHEGLQDASRLYYGDGDLDAMFDRLEPLHALMDRGPQTMREIAFEQSFGEDLKTAHNLCLSYRRSRNVALLNQAWERYYLVFRKINTTVQKQTNRSLDLAYASPKLLTIKMSEIAVPGTYAINRETIRIACFSRILDVLDSKQHPRKLKVTGDDGLDYHFLLKGHEDIRQDERVVQFFGLVNTLLVQERETAKRRLSIQTFSVTPLSVNSGLIGWVSHSDTFHVLIREFRRQRGALFDLELKLMLQDTSKYEKHTYLQQIEIFSHTMERTSGQDLYRILWLKSPDSESWLERRTNYTRSLAVMSMVGHVLGLGDRHPSNLLFNRKSGMMFHVDFGDCFEIAMSVAPLQKLHVAQVTIFCSKRERFPETVPFRLTRMLVKAMEVSGVDGTFRVVCEQTMRVLRDHRETLVALLQAFAFDPLINWRLLDNKKKPARSLYPSSSIMEASPNVDGETITSPFVLDKRAVEVIERVQLKLLGREFHETQALDCSAQVDTLIRQARDPANLARMYLGWCAFW